MGIGPHLRRCVICLSQRTLDTDRLTGFRGFDGITPESGMLCLNTVVVKLLLDVLMDVCEERRRAVSQTRMLNPMIQ